MMRGCLLLSWITAGRADTRAVKDLLHRVVGDAAEHFDLSLAGPDGWCDSPVQECTEFSAKAGTVSVKATSVSSLALGVGTYLREHCNASLTRNVTGGLSAQGCSSGSLPAASVRTLTRTMKWTYYQNVVDSSYSFVWYDFDRWSQEIDWMALNGVNIGLVYTGQEKILQDTYAEFGVHLNDTAGASDFFNGPAFLSWSRGQGQSGTGGMDAFRKASVGALPSWWIETQAELGKKQAARMRELGITTILRGFEGNVPGQLKALHPEANITKLSATNWLLDALDPLFGQLADAYMKRLIAEFGTDHYYQADGLFTDKTGPWALQESHHASADVWPEPDEDAARHSAAAYGGLARTDPEAVWVYQSWIWRGFGDDKRAYLRGWISSIPKGKGLFLDQTAEWVPIWQKFGNWSFLGVPFIWCAMSNMGGNSGLYGDLPLLASAPVEAQRAPNSSMAGIGIDPEGADTNAAYFHYLLASAWRSEESTKPLNASSWLESWAIQRCGRYSANAVKAWRLLGETVYAHSSKQNYEHHMAYCPTTMPQGSGWDKQHGSERPSWYSLTTLHEAWGALLDAAEDCEASAGFVFDLVDVGREFLSVSPCNSRYDALIAASTVAAVQEANASVAEFMLDLDKLLATSDGFLLGRWVADAREVAAASGAASDANFLEWNAKSQVTSWYPSAACDDSASKLDGLWDYGNKAWSGLVHGYYDRRLQLYAEVKVQALQQGNSFVSTPALAAAVMQLACEFQHNTESLPSKPTGDALSVGRSLWQKYAPAAASILLV